MNRRHMMGDHHGRSAGQATLLVRAADGILGTHRLGLPGQRMACRKQRPATDKRACGRPVLREFPPAS